MTAAVGRFQCGVAALIYHEPSRTYLLARRASKRDFGAGEWECVTGRVDQGESFERALFREVSEELGVSVQIDFIIGTTHFYRGPQRPENELLGVKYACSIADRDSIRIGDEHDEARWLTREEIDGLLPGDHWLRATVAAADTLRSALPSGIIAAFRRSGFESD